jgi:hypothetical protein
MLALVAVLLLLIEDRGAGPVVQANGGWASLGSPEGAVAAAAGLMATWAGLAVIAVPTAWTWAAIAEDGVDVTMALHGVRLRWLLAASAGWALAVAAIGTLAVAGVVVAGGQLIEPGHRGRGGGSSVVDGRTVLAVVASALLWWALGATIGVLVRSAVAAGATTVALTVTGLIAANLLGDADPVVWLAALGGLEPGASALTGAWAHGSALGWHTDRPASSAAVVRVVGSALVLAVLATVVVDGGRSRRGARAVSRERWWRSGGGEGGGGRRTAPR